MTKTILITGATDGIGLLTVKNLAAEGHTILLHGRSAEKLEAAARQVGGDPETFRADLSRLSEVRALVEAVLSRHDRLDVLINNAGVYKTPRTHTPEGLDVRFMVNTIAPYLLTRQLLPIIPATGRVVNLSSAAQAPVDVRAMRGQRTLDDMGAYAQSKLAITIWTREMAKEHPDGPVFIAVNPGSLLASKMVKEGFGVAGNDLQIGADILRRTALSDAFSDASGKYFDNDSGGFASSHAGALDPHSVADVMSAIEEAAEVTARE
ncbi:SDR family NAD(P)-dependent oxidoreductase [Ruegeria sp. HKCCD8929]|uniref:SDR family NAD(P)-dependent oxidoreductase n=1 Tax=Ruegeria sp. HKCCD8929 TaxID=2683006 RepID=UPI001488170B|nr:SDR family NAD(P)-dependent oxidoreductase [Ruegeria sp. HKCCD8929]